MFFELIGTIVAGAVAALLVWALNRTLKGRLPKWLIPAAAGAAMLAATISSEYSWYGRTVATMPAGLAVAQTIEETALYRPWTHARPFVSRFVAVDRISTRTHPDQPGLRLVDLVFYGRWTRTAKVPMLFDCAGNLRADVVDGVAFGDGGAVLNAQWFALDATDPLLRTACAEN
ncbi:hypothetical protein [Yoonia sediminilitoris]|uniref:Uncharacterized protein n=1 Tax=Yoonia sediminilitoris TaxID=1286148 RepID=A0A2T6KLI5_9RHOB|nr:hypothetical protein [Yoonia sediminilitoris]PUB17017.1 hypothetical protein C8N45_10227 [Yoonia sediminilitoris]RCW97312.1 hypothetical protein DFP92_10227 [Yoonia sediminilitoris]